MTYSPSSVFRFFLLLQLLRVNAAGAGEDGARHAVAFLVVMRLVFFRAVNLPLQLRVGVVLRLPCLRQRRLMLRLMLHQSRLRLCKLLCHRLLVGFHRLTLQRHVFTVAVGIGAQGGVKLALRIRAAFFKVFLLRAELGFRLFFRLRCLITRLRACFVTGDV